MNTHGDLGWPESLSLESCMSFTTRLNCPSIPEEVEYGVVQQLFLFVFNN